MINGCEFTIHEHNTVLQASKKMMKYHSNALVVVDDFGGMVGIITESDITRKCYFQEKSIHTMKAWMVMTSNPISVAVGTTIRKCVDIMNRGKFRHLPVTDSNNKVTQLFDILKISKMMMKKLINNPGYMESFHAAFYEFITHSNNSSIEVTSTKPNNNILNISLRDMYLAKAFTDNMMKSSGGKDNISANENLPKALQLMKQYMLSALLVYDESENLVGILTERDIVKKIVSLELDPKHYTCRDIMTPSPDICYFEDTLVTAIKKMLKGGYRHLPVMMKNKKFSECKLLDAVSISDYVLNQQELLDLDICIEKPPTTSKLNSFVGWVGSSINNIFNATDHNAATPNSFTANTTTTNRRRGGNHIILNNNVAAITTTTAITNSSPDIVNSNEWLGATNFFNSNEGEMKDFRDISDFERRRRDSILTSHNHDNKNVPVITPNFSSSSSTTTKIQNPNSIISDKIVDGVRIVEYGDGCTCMIEDLGACGAGQSPPLAPNFRYFNEDDRAPPSSTIAQKVNMCIARADALITHKRFIEAIEKYNEAWSLIGPLPENCADDKAIRHRACILANRGATYMKGDDCSSSDYKLAAEDLSISIDFAHRIPETSKFSLKPLLDIWYIELGKAYMGQNNYEQTFKAFMNIEAETMRCEWINYLASTMNIHCSFAAQNMDAGKFDQAKVCIDTALRICTILDCTSKLSELNVLQTRWNNHHDYLNHVKSTNIFSEEKSAEPTTVTTSGDKLNKVRNLARLFK